MKTNERDGLRRAITGHAPTNAAELRDLLSAIVECAADARDARHLAERSTAVLQAGIEAVATAIETMPDQDVKATAESVGATIRTIQHVYYAPRWMPESSDPEYIQ
jgi:hypothetical protein